MCAGLRRTVVHPDPVTLTTRLGGLDTGRGWQVSRTRSTCLLNRGEWVHNFASALQQEHMIEPYYSSMLHDSANAFDCGVSRVPCRARVPLHIRNATTEVRELAFRSPLFGLPLTPSNPSDLRANYLTTLPGGIFDSLHRLTTL